MREERGIFLLSLAALGAVTALALVVGHKAVVIELLLVGPVIAAFGTSPRQTAIVAFLALIIAIPLGLATDAFGSTDHLTGVVAVGLVGGLAVGIARLRSDRERDAARLSVQYGVARVLAEAESLEGAAAELLETIGAPLGWEVGHLLETRSGDALRAVASWQAEGVEASDFEEVTMRLPFGPGYGLPGRVWETGEPAWLTDVIAADNFPRREEARRGGLQGGMAFPVSANGERVAVLEFFARGAREPEPETIALMQALGSLIGEFIEGQRTAEAVRASEARKSAVLASALDAVITIDHEGRIVEFNPAAESIFGRRAEDALGAELAELVVPPALRERHRAGLRRTVETGESDLLGERIELTGMRADGSEFPVELAINRIGGTKPPMFTGTVRDITDRRRFDEEREELLRLEQLARWDTTQARDQLEAILSGVADAITAQAPDGRLLFANDAAVELMGFASREELLAAPLDQLRRRFEIIDEQGEPFPVERYPGRRALAGEGDSEAVMILRMRDTGEELWTKVKATPIYDGAGSVVMAINVTEDITRHIRAERAQRFLSEASAVISASLDATEVLEQVASLAVPEIADWLFIDMVGDGLAFERVAAAHSDPARLERANRIHHEHPPARDGRRGAPRVLQSGRSELYPNLQEVLSKEDGGRSQFRLAREFGMRSGIVVPMIARGRTLGTLTLATDPAGRRFDALDLELAEELALRCASAIDNARLFSERAYIARTLQQSLLPAELPDIPGIEAAARFRPTGQGSEVGGDFYDLFESGGRGWTIVMGDVCGKGPDAAAVTGLARYTLRAAAMRERLPSRCLRLLNEALLRQRDDRRFCTVAYAYLETGEEGTRVGFASGGHPLPLLVRPDGTVEPVGEPGTLLGVLPDPHFEDYSLSLTPGDALVFYTDGVIEGRGGGSMLDEAALVDLLRSCAGAGADAIAGHVEDAAVKAQGGSPRDDIAVLVLRVAV